MDNSLVRMDINLLMTLDVLLREQNVTRAAEKLHLAQPTVSSQLARLRAFFDDPLLLPHARGMLPTARANQLREPLHQALAHLQQAIASSESFNPQSARQIWKIAASDYTASAILLPMLASLRLTAPQSKLAIVNICPDSVARQLEQGEIDLAFHVREDAALHLRSTTLFTEHYVLTGRLGHPKLNAAMDLKQFCDLEQAIFSPNKGDFSAVVDEVLAEQGFTRNVVLSVSSFLVLQSALEHSDMVAMLPFRLVCRNPALQWIEPPFELPGFEMLMLWSEHMHRDAAHQWFRQYIVQNMMQT